MEISTDVIEARNPRESMLISSSTMATKWGRSGCGAGLSDWSFHDMIALDILYAILDVIHGIFTKIKEELIVVF